MASITVRSLIYQAILDTQPKPFRNKDIALATGAERQRVNECLNILMRENVLTKDGPEYWVSDLSAFINFMIKGSLGVQKEKQASKFLGNMQPHVMDWLVEAICLVENQRAAKDWKPLAERLKKEMIEDITTTIETLQIFRSELKSGKPHGPILKHVATGKQYTGNIQGTFKKTVAQYLGDEAPGELFTDHVRPSLREFFGYDDSVNE